MSEQLRGKIAIVTGASNGIGRGIAETFAAEGAKTVLIARRKSLLDEVAAGIKARGGEALPMPADLTHEEAVIVLFAAVAKTFGRLDVLVNNAGIGMRTVNPRFMTDPQPFWEVSDAGFRDVLTTKAAGTFLVSRAVVPRMLDDGGGRVVTISMSETTMTRRGFVPYGPSGAAVEALARVMAADLAGTPVAANILLPGGPTATGMVPDDVGEEVRARLLDPSVMGPPIVWLASPDAAGVHDERIVARDFADWLSARRRRT